MVTNATAGSINIITDQSIKKGDQINTSFAVGSLGKFGSYLSATKTKNNFSVKGNHNLIFSDGYRREIVLYIKIMEELSFPTIICTTIFI